MKTEWEAISRIITILGVAKLYLASRLATADFDRRIMRANSLLASGYAAEPQRISIARICIRIKKLTNLFFGINKFFD